MGIPLFAPLIPKMEILFFSTEKIQEVKAGIYCILLCGSL